MGFPASPRAAAAARAPAAGTPPRAAAGPIHPARRCTKAGWENVKFHCSKDLGMVRDVFSSVATVEKLLGNVGIAHVRYPTAGGASCDEVQPFYAGREKGDSTSLQRECSARARFGNSTHASRALREMIARPKNQPKRAENDRDRSL